MYAGTATDRPAAVQTSASEMPPASMRGSPMPPSITALNAWMMPVTVPSRPNKGEMLAMVPTEFTKRSSSWTTCRPTSSTRSIMMSRPRCRLANAVASTRPSGEFFSSASMTLALTWCRSASSDTFLMRSWGKTRLRCSVQRRSSTIPTSAMEHRMIGHMNGPPARTISHMAGIIPEGAGNRHSTAPGEGILLRARSREHRESMHVQPDFDGTLAQDIDDPYTGFLPAPERLRACGRAGLATRGDGEPRATGFYPLPAGSPGAGAAAQENHLTGQRGRWQARQQPQLRGRIEVTREEHRVPAHRHSQDATAGAGREQFEFHAVARKALVPAPP